METLEGFIVSATVGEVSYVATPLEKSPLEPLMSLIRHLTVLLLSLLLAPVRHHQLAACLGLPSQER